MNADEIKLFFEEHGYYHAKRVFTGDPLNNLAEDYDRIVNQLVRSGDELNARWTNPEAMKKMKSEDSVILHTNNVQQYSGQWMSALFHPNFLFYANALLGEDVVLHHTKLFQKPPSVGAPFPMHQDWSYFPTLKDSMLAGIMHLTEATNEMGCLRVYPGSHRLGRIPNSNGQVKSEFLEKYPMENATILEAEPGDIVFFHYFTLHGSMPNVSEKTRKTVLIQLYAGDDVTEPGIDHPDEKLVLSGWNYHASRSNTAQ
ncbi:phytanoyl-CoA dioxygenase family protein [Maribacter sp. 2-571]|uniref:phytanoyl-CoA dioxygenase family protein n=1 Tax=Maribacter sp. 2-571 TaxID=3417569 RepID=UPI003D328E0C